MYGYSKINVHYRANHQAIAFNSFTFFGFNLVDLQNKNKRTRKTESRIRIAMFSCIYIF